MNPVDIEFYDRAGTRFIGNIFFAHGIAKTEEEWDDFVKEQFPNTEGAVIMISH